MNHCLCYSLFIHAIIFFFFFNDTATTEIYTLSLHDALPIFKAHQMDAVAHGVPTLLGPATVVITMRSEEHTSELQSRLHLVCRLLLEKKKTKPFHPYRQRQRASTSFASTRHFPLPRHSPFRS